LDLDVDRLTWKQKTVLFTAIVLRHNRRTGTTRTTGANVEWLQLAYRRGTSQASAGQGIAYPYCNASRNVRCTWTLFLYYWRDPDLHPVRVSHSREVQRARIVEHI